jgi:hypothetical protein
MALPARPITLETVEAEVTRKRTYTLVMRTPDQPRAAPASIASEAPDLYLAPLEAHELPASTALAMLDRRVRREGKNSEYIRVMAIERGRGRGGRGRGGRV